MMALHAQETVFQPTTSWMSRAGVMVEYSPEDTFKSLIERGLVDQSLLEDEEDYDNEDISRSEKILSAISASSSYGGGMSEDENELDTVLSGPTSHDEQQVAGCHKPFELIIEEQMRLEEARIRQNAEASQPKKKVKTFLKRGEGLSRFKQQNNHAAVRKQVEQQRNVSSKQSGPNAGCLQNQSKRPAEGTRQLKRHTTAGQQEVVIPSINPESTREDADPVNETTNYEDELEEFELFEKYADSSFESSISSIARLDKEKLLNKLKLKQSRSKDSTETNSVHVERPKEVEVATPSAPAEPAPFAQPKQSASYPQQNNRFPSRGVRKSIEKSLTPTTSRQRSFRDDQVWEDSESHVTSHSEDSSHMKSQELDDTISNGIVSSERPLPSPRKLTESSPRKVPQSPPRKVSEPPFRKVTEPAADLQDVISNISDAVFPRLNSNANSQISQHTKLLVEKLAELEKDYAMFAREKKTLARQRREVEEEKRELKAKVAEFEKQKTEKMAEINDFKEKESKRLRKERRTLEEYERVMKNGLTRENRQELESLKARLAEVYEEMTRRENKFQSAQGRMRDRIAALEKERDELREQVHNLEAIRTDLQAKLISSQPTAFGVAKKMKPSFPPMKESVQHIPTEAEETIFQQSKRLQQRLNDSSEPARRTWDAYQQVVASSTSTMASQPRQQQSAPTATQYLTPFAPSEVSSTLTSSSYNSGGKPTTAPRLTANEESVTVGSPGKELAVDEKLYPDGKIEKINGDGSRIIVFPNGTVKEVSADKQEVCVKFFNGDVKRVFADRRITYFYGETETTHTTYPDGMETMQFVNGQKEVIYPDKTREIVFPDGVRKYIYPNKTELSMFPSGMIVKVLENGDKEINFTNGQREIHTKDYKRREYPDGTTKTLYPDGRQETRYSSGRLRVKDKSGRIVENRKCSPVRSNVVSSEH